MHVRPYDPSDEPRVLSIFQRAFAGPPWHAAWSDQEVERLWRDNASRRGFECLLAVVDDRVAAATWHDAPSEEDLRGERGQELADFARGQNASGPVLWVRETVCDPDFQGRGLTGKLKEAALEHLRKRYPGALILTRMRDDNLGIVRINQRLGFRKTGLRAASKAYPGLMHDYWFLRV